MRGISEDMNDEIWLPVKGREIYYEVSSLGNIRKISGEVISQCKNDQGYSLVRLSNPRAMVRVHRLVAIAFVDNENSHTVINHIDNNRSNNYYKNLEWCTQKHNLHHAAKQGRINWDQRKGSIQSKVMNDKDISSEIRSKYLNGLISYKGITREYKISLKTAKKIIESNNPV